MQSVLSGTRPVAAWRWGEFVLMPLQRRLLCADQTIEIEDRVLDLLVLLLQHRDRALGRQEVIAALWGKRPVSDATLRQLVYKARRAVGDDGERQATIATLYGRSLQWVALVTPEFGDAAAATAAASEAPAAPPASRSGAERQAQARGVYGYDRRTGADRRRAIAAPDLASRAVAAGSGAPAAGRHVRRWRRRWLAAAVLVIAGAGVAATWWWLGHSVRVTAATGVAEKATTLAVLPFRNLGPQPDQRYLGDGLTEELINRLARMPHLRVTARTSSFAVGDAAIDVREAARRLGVANVLEGSVQRARGRLRVRVALVDARTGYERWANAYDAGAGDLLGMEDRIATSVVATLYPKLSAAALPRGSLVQRVDPAAHDAYLVALEYLRQRDFTDIDRAIAHFRRAIAADPGYVDAWTGLAGAYAMLRDYNPDEQPDTHYPDALAAVNRALLLDPQSPRAHAVLGMLYMRHWQWRQADAEYRHALAIDPDDATTHHWYATYFWLVGDMPGALAQMRTAIKLDPLSPIINAKLSRTLLFAGDIDGAIRQGQAAVELAPRFELAHLFLGEALEAKGLYQDAIRETRAGIATLPPPTESDDLSSLGRLQWEAGDHVDAVKVLDELEARSRQHYVSGVAMAYIEWTVGRKDRAFESLARAVADHDALLITITGMRNREWRSDPRFPKLLARMNLPVR